MCAPFKNLILIAIFLSGAPNASWAIDDEDPFVLKMVELETGANPMVKKSSALLHLQHFEIPLGILSKDIGIGFTEEMKNALIFKKHGIQYLRWVIHPDDTTYYKETAKLIRRLGISAEKKTYLLGHYTASRSLIITDPKTKKSFSLKVSTDHTGGLWNDKKHWWLDAKRIRKVSDFLMDAKTKIKFKYFDILPDVASFGFNFKGQAMTVRSLEGLIKGEYYYLPAFSVFDKKVSAEIAKLNGGLNSHEYWKENFIRPLARSFAEFSAYFGFTFNSPHSQNFYIELDPNFKPTGRICFKDLGDIEVSNEFLKKLNRPDLMKWFPKDHVKEGFHVGVSILKGIENKKVISRDNAKKWMEVFFVEFEKTFQEITGADVFTPSNVKMKIGEGEFDIDLPKKSTTFSKYYLPTGQKWVEFQADVNTKLGWKKLNILGPCIQKFFGWIIPRS